MNLRTREGRRAAFPSLRSASLEVEQRILEVRATNLPMNVVHTTKNGISDTIEDIDSQIDALLAELSLVREYGEAQDEELEDMYFEAGALKERMRNVISLYNLA